ncbi:MAG: TIGR02757 family protein [Treponemataceae bacterium]
MPPSRAELHTLLETVFADCHTPELLDPDPLIVVREYTDVADREIVALLCASLALGRASAIVAACRRALAPFGPHPYTFITAGDFNRTLKLLSGFKYRFFDEYDVAALLFASASLSREYGGLEVVFISGAAEPVLAYRDEPVSALLLSRCDTFIARLRSSAGSALGTIGQGTDLKISRNLLSAPCDGSACKRLMLFLRWMVRRDALDPGGWTGVSTSELVLPLDVHLHRISLVLGMTGRASADLRSALEVSAVLRSIDAADPIRFDFSLARLGIRSDYSLQSFYRT